MRNIKKPVKADNKYNIEAVCKAMQYLKEMEKGKVLNTNKAKDPDFIRYVIDKYVTGDQGGIYESETGLFTKILEAYTYEFEYAFIVKVK